MKVRSQLSAILAIILLSIMLSASFPLEAISGNLVSSEVSLLQTSSTYNVTVSPNYIQEGFNTTLTVSVQAANDTTCYFRINVTDPAGASYAANISVATDAVGYGVNSTQYWGNFSGAQTNLVGVYNVLLKNATSDETLKTADFTVGLTDKFEYQRNETVQIQATGYSPSEKVILDLKIGVSSVDGFPRNLTTNSSGVVTLSWQVPLNATAGTYSLALTNTTSGGTRKLPSDVQNFKVLGVVCKIQTKNIADAAVGDVSVEVYKAAMPNSSLMSGNSNGTGWIISNLDAGNYTFKALWRGVQVGALNKSITADTAFNFTLQLTNIRIIIEDAGGGLPLIDIRFSYNYTTRANENKSDAVSLKTNITGMAEINNVFVNLTYILSAWHYGLPLPGTPLRNETLKLPLNNIVILVPKYTAFARVFDSKGFAVSGVRIAAYEWSSGTTQSMQTRLSVDGNVTFLLTFGKYRLRALYDSLVLNETTLDLIQDNLNFTFYLTIFNIDATVWVRDYFGQPIANANVTIERKTGDKYVFAYSQFTGRDGSTTFASKVGGDSRISVYVAGRLAAVKTQFLATGSNHVAFGIGGYVTVLGYPIEAGLFASFSFILVLVVFVLIWTRRRWVQAFRKKRKG